MPRPANPDVRRRLLDSGLSLMHQHGFAGAGIADITSGADVPKGSFYSYYASKEAFAGAVLAHYWAPIARDLLPLLDERRRSAADSIEIFFHSLADNHARDDFRLGCLVGRLALELSGASDPARDELQRVLEHWEQALARCLERGVRDGSVTSNRPPAELGSLLIEAWEGAALRGKVARSRAPYDRFEQSLLPELLARSV